jgi:branched-chain amino acid transport system permease protein
VSSVFVPSASTVLIYVAMVATLMIRPQGLFGER